MMNLSKSARTLIIAAAALAVLGTALAVLVLTKPKERQEQSSSVASGSGIVAITDKKADDVLRLSVSNESGSYTFYRSERVVSSTGGDGTVSSQNQYYWTSGELKGVPQNDSAVRNFVDALAGLSAKSVVEENAEDLDKYGLETPLVVADIGFEDGTGEKMLFGIQNPANESSVYFRLDNSATVYMVNYYSVRRAYSDIREYANLLMTEDYITDGSNELDYLIVERKDLDEPVELRFMSDVAEAAEDEDSVITTFNTHRFVRPLTAEIDMTKGKDLSLCAYGMTMTACEFLEQSAENMRECGLDEPYAKVTFKFSGRERTLLLGNKIIGSTQSGVDNAPALTDVKGYYAVLEGVPGIYSIDTESAPWYDFSVSDVISKRPVSPYIYSVESITITLPAGEYKFDIDGENKTFSHNGRQLDPPNFRSLYQQLISSIGEEMYTEQTDGTPYISVKFRYLSKYFDTYGTEEDVLEFFGSGDRKCIVNLNGKTIFKVREIYASRLIENVNALLNGEDVNPEW